MGNTTTRNLSTTMATMPKPKVHLKCLQLQYPRDNITRFPVPEDKVPWQTPFPEYKPVDYTSQSVFNKPVWADLDIRTENSVQPQWNTIDGKVDRRSHTGKYTLDPVTQLPRNPVGRTGMCGRGCLGRWGPNHAADPIVTRWKRNATGHVSYDDLSGRPILQFIAIQRRDSGEWAIPGGMVDPGEKVSATLKREFSEEAMNSLEATAEDRYVLEQNITELFSKGIEVYRGYVDDPRNTDNSWMETIAVNFHDNTGESVGKFSLHAGDDAVGVRWTDIDSKLKLFASHSDFIHQIAKRHQAHW